MSIAGYDAWKLASPPDDPREGAPCPHPDCDEDAGHRGRHTHRCDDGSCCEPPEPDYEAPTARERYEAACDDRRKHPQEEGF